MTLIQGSMLQQKMMEQGEREARLADEPFGPEPPRGDDYVAFYEAAGMEEGDRFVWDFDGEESEVVAVFEARQGGLLADEGDDIIHFTSPDHDTPQVVGAEDLGAQIANGDITLEVEG